MHKKTFVLVLPNEGQLLVSFLNVEITYPQLGKKLWTFCIRSTYLPTYLHLLLFFSTWVLRGLHLRTYSLLEKVSLERDLRKAIRWIMIKPIQPWSLKHPQIGKRKRKHRKPETFSYSITFLMLQIIMIPSWSCSSILAKVAKFL